jgi:hypothetical protein
MPDQELNTLRRVWRTVRGKITGVRLLGAVVLALTIVTGLQGYAQGKATERQGRETERQAEITKQLVSCLRTYSNELADAIELRSKASAEAQDASDNLWFGVAQAPQTQEGRDQARRVFDDYIAKRAAAKKTQTDHPYPPPPRDVCG